MTVYGTDGVLICPDPNMFCGPVKLIRNGGKEYVEMPLTHAYSGEEASVMPAPPEKDIMKRCGLLPAVVSALRISPGL